MGRATTIDNSGDNAFGEIRERLTELNQGQATLQTGISNLQLQMSDLQADMTEVKEDIKVIKMIVSKQSSDLDDHEARLKRLEQASRLK